MFILVKLLTICGCVAVCFLCPMPVIIVAAVFIILWNIISILINGHKNKKIKKYY